MPILIFPAERYSPTPRPAISFCSASIFFCRRFRLHAALSHPGYFLCSRSCCCRADSSEVSEGRTHSLASAGSDSGNSAAVSGRFPSGSVQSDCQCSGFVFLCHAGPGLPEGEQLCSLPVPCASATSEAAWNLCVLIIKHITGIPYTRHPIISA